MTLEFHSFFFADLFDSLVSAILPLYRKILMGCASYPIIAKCNIGNRKNRHFIMNKFVNNFTYSIVFSVLCMIMGRGKNGNKKIKMAMAVAPFGRPTVVAG
jgi:hypothetical protein